jgi:aryl-alcohol dehydrogenase-like predicted oxidoreductase
VAAVHALAAIEGTTACEALCKALLDPVDETSAVAAAQALARRLETPAHDALRRAALGGTSLKVRLWAVRGLRCRADAADAGLLGQILEQEPEAAVRREALRALWQLPPPQRWPVLAALSDPVWRVRHEAVLRFHAWQQTDPSVLLQVRTRLEPLAERAPATIGALRYLEFLCDPATPPPPRKAPLPAERVPFWWDDDPPVLEQNLRHLTREEIVADLPALIKLVTLQDGRPVLDCLRRIQRFVASAVAQFGEPCHLGEVLRLLEEPRRPLVVQWVRQLLARLDSARKEQAAELLGRPLAEIAPPRTSTGVRQEPASDNRPLARTVTAVVPPAQPRPLGQTGLTVSPLGISGRYGLPERGFAEAIEAGVNLFFWEPSYRTQTRFWSFLPVSLKEKLVVIAGSFAATPARVRRDLEQALQALGLERLGIFLLYWVRSPGRLSEDVLDLLDRLRTAGLVQSVGLSTHLRPLAVQAIRDGWPLLMIRHSAAHRGAEDELLPLAARSGTGIITFSNLFYGRILRPAGGDREQPAPQAVDCYRYSLSQPGVHACLSAPADAKQLRHNLQVLQRPSLTAEEMSALRPFGDAAYRQHRAFSEWIRSR